MKPSVNGKSFHDFYSFKKNLLSMHSGTRIPIWILAPSPSSNVTLGKSLNPSGPQFPLLENADLFLEKSTVLMEHLLYQPMCQGLPGGGWHPALVELAVVTVLGQFCNFGGTCAHFPGLGFYITDAFLASHAIFACLSLFHGFLTLCLQLSVNYLKWYWFGEKLPTSHSSLFLYVSHIWAPGGGGGVCVTLFPPLFVLESMPAFQVILPFLKILNVFSICACLKLTHTKWYFYHFNGVFLAAVVKAYYS